MIYILFCALPDFVKTNPLKTQTTIIKLSLNAWVTQTKSMSFSLSEHTSAARWGLWDSSFITPHVQEKVNVYKPYWCWLDLKHSTSRRVHLTRSLNGHFTGGKRGRRCCVAVWDMGHGDRKVMDVLVEKRGDVGTTTSHLSFLRKQTTNVFTLRRLCSPISGL